MKNTDPILKFRILNESESNVAGTEWETHSAILESHTTITKTREAADSSEHSDTNI